MSYMLVPNFEAIDHVTLVLEPEKPPRKFGAKNQKSVKNGLSTAKIFHVVVYLMITFHPNQPTFGHDEVFFFFFPFFSS